MPADEDRVMTGRLLLGARLRRLRTQRRLQLADVAELSGLSPTHISEIERGRKMPTLPALDALAGAYGMTASRLLSGVYPWGSTEPPATPVTGVPDGRSRKYRVEREVSDEGA